MMKTVLRWLLGCVVSAGVWAQLPVEPALLDTVGWKMLWQASVPLKNAEHIDRMFVQEDHLYILTDMAYLFCFHRETGRLRFVASLASKRLPICEPLFVDDQLWFMVGNELVRVDGTSGTVVGRQFFDNVGNSFGCGIAVSPTTVYLAGSDRRLHAFDRQGFWRRFSVTADDKTLIQWPIYAGNCVVFNTQGGAVVAMAAESPTKLWQFDTTGALHAAMACDGKFVYVGGDDTRLYKLNLQSGMMAWRQPFLAGAKIRQAPKLGQLAVYLFVATQGLFAIDPQRGVAVWHLPDGLAVVTETDRYSVALCQPGRLVVMEHSQGQKLFELNAAQVRHTATWFQQPRLYLASQTGQLVGIAVQ